MIKIEPGNLRIGVTYYFQNVRDNIKYSGIYTGSNGLSKNDYSFFTHLVVYNDKLTSKYIEETFHVEENHLFRCKYHVYYEAQKFQIYLEYQKCSFFTIIEEKTDRTSLQIPTTYF